MTTKKKVLGVDPLSWIKKTGDDVYGDDVYIEEEKLSEQDREKKEVPKYESYEVKLTVRLSEEHLEFLSSLEREIMKSRSKINRKERITKNSIIRSIINAFRDLGYEKTEISTEEELTRRIKNQIKKGIDG